MSNYPDDIRQYDHHPQSPFYTPEPECPECGNETLKWEGDQYAGEEFCTECDYTNSWENFPEEFDDSFDLP